MTAGTEADYPVPHRTAPDRTGPPVGRCITAPEPPPNPFPHRKGVGTFRPSGSCPTEGSSAPQGVQIRRKSGRSAPQGSWGSTPREEQVSGLRRLSPFSVSFLAIALLIGVTQVVYAGATSTSLVGPTGPTGPNGLQGPQGATGRDGAPGLHLIGKLQQPDAYDAAEGAVERRFGIQFILRTPPLDRKSTRLNSSH